jgi:hypothetical protein
MVVQHGGHAEIGCVCTSCGELLHGRAGNGTAVSGVRGGHAILSQMAITYLTPHVMCENLKYYHEILLPLTKLPLPPQGATALSEWFLDKTPVSSWPPEEWNARLGCSDCGLVDWYHSGHVGWKPVDHQTEGSFRADVVCVLVEFLCDTPKCKTPVKFHTLLAERTEKAYTELHRKLVTGFFRGPCDGHGFVFAAPRERLKVTEVPGEIPSLED